MDPAVVLCRPPARTFGCLESANDSACAVKVASKIGLVVILCHGRDSLAVYDLGTGSWVRDIRPSRPTVAFCLSHDADFVLATQPSSEPSHNNAHVQFLCLRSGTRVRNLYLDNCSSQDNLYDIACNKEFVVLLEDVYTVAVVNIFTGFVWRRFRPHPNRLFCCIHSVCLLPRTDGRMIVVLGDDCIAHLTTVDLTSGNILGSKDSNMTGLALHAVASPNNGRLIAYNPYIVVKEDGDRFTSLNFVAEYGLTGLAATEDGGFVVACPNYFSVYPGLDGRLAWLSMCSLYRSSKMR